MPKQLENLLERELFTHTYYLAVVCDDVVLVERMRKGRGVSDDEWIRYPCSPVSYTHLRAHETKANLVCRLLLEKKKKIKLILLKTRDQ